MNMDLWVREQIATQDKKAMPLLSYPAVQQQFITVDQLIHSSSEMALGVRLMADRYNMPFASTYMDLSIEAEAFAGITNKSVYIPENVTAIEDGAFDETMTIMCKRGSWAEEWAVAKGFQPTLID